MELSFEELRVLGCLIEKSANTPEHYPLTSNSLTAACNQKSSREPVVSFTTRQVDETVLLLRQAGLARSNISGRSSKHRHLVEAELGLSTNQSVVLSVLMLRGAQSAGELKTRTDRALGLDGPSEIERILESLASRDEPFVRDIGRGNGQSQNRWIHLLGDAASTELQNTELQTVASEQDTLATPRGPRADQAPDRVAEASLTARVIDLEKRLMLLEAELGMGSGPAE